jgi:hypothetical protein
MKWRWWNFEYKSNITLQKIDKKNQSSLERPEMKHYDGTYGLTLPLKTLIWTLPRYYLNILNYTWVHGVRGSRTHRHNVMVTYQ